MWDSHCVFCDNTGTDLNLNQSYRGTEVVGENLTECGDKEGQCQIEAMKTNKQQEGV